MSAVSPPTWAWVADRSMLRESELHPLAACKWFSRTIPMTPRVRPAHLPRFALRLHVAHVRLRFTQAARAGAAPFSASCLTPPLFSRSRELSALTSRHHGPLRHRACA